MAVPSDSTYCKGFRRDNDQLNCLDTIRQEKSLEEHSTNPADTSHSHTQQDRVKPHLCG